MSNASIRESLTMSPMFNRALARRKTGNAYMGSYWIKKLVNVCQCLQDLLINWQLSKNRHQIVGILMRYHLAIKGYQEVIAMEVWILDPRGQIVLFKYNSQRPRNTYHLSKRY